jgi:metallophosphoesterase superfamily enzyme
MGRPPTRPTDLKDGFYIEVRNKGTNSGIKLRRDTRKEMEQAIVEYKKIKDVIILGECKNCKWIDEGHPKKA